MTTMNELTSTIKSLSKPGTGLLAADESTATITKRFQALNIESTEETRRAYRTLLFTTPGLNEFVSGVILYEETLTQNNNEGIALPTVLSKNGIIPGIKVDKGLVSLPFSPEEKVTQGLDGLAERLVQYKQQGARFAKWREVFTISNVLPSQGAIQSNAEVMARYASICQSQGIVPIVEPEILIDGDHSLERCYEVSENVLGSIFNLLHRHHVSLEHIILKPSMVIAGLNHSRKSSAKEVADATITVLRRTVPSAVPTINFLSGGQTPQQATENLQAMNANTSHPWNVSFSYARALQEPCMAAWRGNPENINAAQNALYKRAKLNSAAALGKYDSKMES